MTSVPASPAPAAPPARTGLPPREPVTPGMMESLRNTKPWVRFLSILGFIGSGIVLLGALVVMVGGAFAGAGGAIISIVLGLLYSAMAILYIIPSRHLYRYASAIDTAVAAPQKTPAVEEALRHQKSFWKFTGIVALVMIFLYIPAIFAAIAIPNLLTAMQRSKQKRTLADMRSISDALKSYSEDYNSYPKASDFDRLAFELESRKYLEFTPRVDGWGNPFRYNALCGGGPCNEYYLVSAGKDGAFEREDPWQHGSTPQATESFDSDIVVYTGVFVKHPQGIVTP